MPSLSSGGTSSSVTWLSSKCDVIQHYSTTVLCGLCRGWVILCHYLACFPGLWLNSTYCALVPTSTLDLAMCCIKIFLDLVQFYQDKQQVSHVHTRCQSELINIQFEDLLFCSNSIYIFTFSGSPYCWPHKSDAQISVELVQIRQTRLLRTLSISQKRWVLGRYTFYFTQFV